MGQTPQVIFRKMTVDDIDAVAEIEFNSFKLPWTLEDFWYETLRKDAESIVAEIDGKVVAYACVWISFEEADLANIAVEKNFRRQGIGKKLLAEIIRRLQLRGINGLTLEVRVSNIAAIKLYEKFGLKGVGVRKGYYEDGEDALIMWNTSIQFL